MTVGSSSFAASLGSCGRKTENKEDDLSFLWINSRKLRHFSRPVCHRMNQQVYVYLTESFNKLDLADFPVVVVVDGLHIKKCSSCIAESQ